MLGGSIQATPAPGGRVNLIVEGSTVNTLLEINQIIPMHSSTAGAHTFNNILGNQNGILNVASITVTPSPRNSSITRCRVIPLRKVPFGAGV